MNATDIVAAVRRDLDDLPQSNYKQGLFYLDSDITAALNASMDAITYWLCEQKKSHLLEKLVSSVSGTGNVSIPADYFYAVTATVSSLPAQVFVGAGGRNFFYGGATFASVEASDIYFRKDGLAASGVLRYYRTPYRMTVDDDDDDYAEAPDFQPFVIDVIRRHATSALAIRLEPNSRHVANMREAAMLLTEQPEQFPSAEAYR